MKELYARTFGAIKTSFYIRELIIASLTTAFYYFGVFGSFGVKPPLELLAVGLLITLLYPYSRLGYNAFVSFMRDNNTVYYTNWFFRLFSILLCYCTTILVAPASLIYLYIMTRDRKQC